MMMPGFQDERLKILHDAMKWKAPKTYADLKKAGILWEVPVDREQEMMQAYSQARFDVVEKWKRENQDLLRPGRGQEFLAKHRQLIGRITDEILDTFTKFADMPEDDEDDVGQHDDVEDASVWGPTLKNEPMEQPSMDKKFIRVKMPGMDHAYLPLKNMGNGSYKISRNPNGPERLRPEDKAPGKKSDTVHTICTPQKRKVRPDYLTS